MPDTKVSAMPATVAPLSTDLVMVVSGGASKQVTIADLVAAAGVSVTPVLTIGAITLPGSVNLSTEGTVDWFAPFAATTPPRTQTAPHAKALGGQLLQGFDWVQNGNSMFTPGSWIPFSTNVGDDMTASLTASTSAIGVFTGAGTLFGFRISVPACALQRTMRIYTAVFSGTMTVTAKLDGTALSPVTLVYAAGAGGFIATPVEIVYKAQGGNLVVTGLLTTNSGSGPNVAIAGITIF